MAPWRQEPRLLLTQRGVIATVILATAVVIAVVASLPVFLSSVGTRPVEAQAADRCGTATGANDARSVPVANLTGDRSNPFPVFGDRLGPARQCIVMQGQQLASGAGGDDGVGVTAWG